MEIGATKVWGEEDRTLARHRPHQLAKYVGTVEAGLGVGVTETSYYRWCSVEQPGPLPASHLPFPSPAVLPTQGCARMFLLIWFKTGLRPHPPIVPLDRETQARSQGKCLPTLEWNGARG